MQGRRGLPRGRFNPTGQHLAVPHDPSGLACERNELRHVPLPSVDVFVGEGAAAGALELALQAAEVVGVPVRVVGHPDEAHGRVRVIGVVPDHVLASWYAAGVEVDRAQPVADATVELRRWVREQAISRTRHRHGRLLD